MKKPLGYRGLQTPLSSPKNFFFWSLIWSGVWVCVYKHKRSYLYFYTYIYILEIMGPQWCLQFQTSITNLSFPSIFVTPWLSLSFVNVLVGSSLITTSPTSHCPLPHLTCALNFLLGATTTITPTWVPSSPCLACQDCKASVPVIPSNTRVPPLPI